MSLFAKHRTLAALALAALFLAGVAPASAASLATATRAAMPASASVPVVHVYLPNFHPRVAAAPVGQPAAPARPATACTTTTWELLKGGVHDFYGSGWHVSMQAEMYIRVDYTNHAIYCGAVEAWASDDLVSGCSEFSGDAYRNNQSTSGSLWGVYHCTDQLYIFNGPEWDEACTAGSFLYVDNADGANNNVYYGPFTC